MPTCTTTVPTGHFLLPNGTAVRGKFERNVGKSFVKAVKWLFNSGNSAKLNGFFFKQNSKGDRQLVFHCALCVEDNKQRGISSLCSNTYCFAITPRVTEKLVGSLGDFVISRNRDIPREVLKSDLWMDTYIDGRSGRRQYTLPTGEVQNLIKQVFMHTRFHHESNPRLPEIMKDKIFQRYGEVVIGVRRRYLKRLQEEYADNIRLKHGTNQASRGTDGKRIKKVAEVPGGDEGEEGGKLDWSDDSDKSEGEEGSGGDDDVKEDNDGSEDSRSYGGDEDGSEDGDDGGRASPKYV